jgi:sec-independent protein translocase protein TatB
MFDIGWSELVLIAVVALIAIGPKELPGVLRTVGQWVGKARKMAGEFQSQFQEALREAEMADLKQSFDEVRSAASGLSGRNFLASLEKDVSNSLRIDDLDKSPETKTAEAESTEINSTETGSTEEATTPAIEPPVTPTTPEAPAPQTFIEAETHAAVTEPLAVVQEYQQEHQQEARQDNQSAGVPDEAAPAAGDGLKDAKAS